MCTPTRIAVVGALFSAAVAAAMLVAVAAKASTVASQPTSVVVEVSVSEPDPPGERR